MEDEAAAEQYEMNNGIPKQTTMLSYAISSRDYEKVRSLLSVTGDRRVNVNQINIYGYTPLFSAVFAGHTPIARLLIENGADVNNGGEAQFSPLMFAVARGNFDMVKMLLTKGADINTMDRVNGENVLHTALRVRDMNIAQFLLSLKPELATEADNEGNLPDVTDLNMEGIHPDIGPLSASRRMDATRVVYRRARDARDAAAAAVPTPSVMAGRAAIARRDAKTAGRRRRRHRGKGKKTVKRGRRRR